MGFVLCIYVLYFRYPRKYSEWNNCRICLICVIWREGGFSSPDVFNEDENK